MPLCAVYKDRDRQEIVADRQLAAGKERPGRDAELMIARLAFPERARLEGVHGGAIATRADRSAIGSGPTNEPESVAGFLVRHARDLPKGKAAGSG